MKELTEVPGLDKEQKVVIKKFSYGDKSKLSGKMTKVIPSNPPTAEVDIGEFKIWSLIYGIKSAPFFNVGVDKRKVIEDLDMETGEYLFKEISEFNKLNDLVDLKKK